jgi:hypothetical protein
MKTELWGAAVRILTFHQNLQCLFYISSKRHASFYRLLLLAVNFMLCAMLHKYTEDELRIRECEQHRY